MRRATAAFLLSMLVMAGCGVNGDEAVTATDGPATTQAPPSEPAPATADLLDAVVARGELNCGVNEILPGFGYKDSEGAFIGFDVDLCRAVAAAILGDA
ncbi:MAG: amino acid ABC transporter substrate-binding protein, partial [bacterium]|nr:amino acid ABC transporter substrate-binding protein [bacterium]